MQQPHAAAAGGSMQLARKLSRPPKWHFFHNLPAPPSRVTRQYQYSFKLNNYSEEAALRVGT
jgi:hypothetical protein